MSNTLHSSVDNRNIHSRIRALGAPKWIVVQHWWRSIDRLILGSALGLVMIGVVLSFAAGPASAGRIPSINDSYYFTERHLIFLGPSVAVMLGISFLSPLHVRRLGSCVVAVAFILLIVTLIAGPEINGARRWVNLRFVGIQPSEFIKPGFIVFAAWMVAEAARDRDFPGGMIAMGLYGLIASVLFLQPDYGQWLLLTAVWGMMFFIAGWSWRWMAGLATVAVGGVSAGYLYAPHVTSRIDRFINPAMGDNYQVEKAMQALTGGGLFGRDVTAGPVAVKYQLPDSHTDFIFAVAGEEFGIVFCATLVVLYAIIVLRSFFASARLQSVFLRCAICGLAAQIGLQAMINISVSLRLLPAKGMTLPFISYGGSSLLASALGLGFILALTRKNTVTTRYKEVMP